MKTLLKVLTVTVALYMGNLIVPQKAQAQVSFQVFYDGLSPYGTWVTDPTYGYVWVPNAGADFTPYGTNGHWVLTDAGWTWVSDYPWGWAPFHYGRWYYDATYGWIWVPDTVWGPAWVSWRVGGGCYGWTPSWVPGIGIGVDFYAPPDRWLFCDQAHFCDPYVYRYYLPRGNYATIYARTTVIGGTYADAGRHATYYYGPRRDDVERVTHTTIRPVAIRESSREEKSSVSGGALTIYRPAVQKTANGARPAPTHVATLRDVKPVAQKSGTVATPARGQTTRTGATHPVSALPNANRAQHTTNVPISKPQYQPATQYPAPYTVHPAKTQPAAAPQRSASPQRSATPSRSAAPQHSAAPAHSAAPQRSATPQRSAPAKQGGGKKPGGR